MVEPADKPYGWHGDMGVPLQDKLKEDLKTALRAKDDKARDTIRQVMAEFPGLTVPITLQSGKKTTRPKKAEEITDDDIIDIIRRLVKSEKTVLEATQATSSQYLDLLQGYLPRMASAEEIDAWIDAGVDFSQFKSPMQAMGPIMKHFGKRADGNTVKQLLQKRLKKSG